jgi:hypothetical protein
MKSVGAGTKSVNTMTNNTNHSTQAKVSAFAYVAPLVTVLIWSKTRS